MEKKEDLFLDDIFNIGPVRKNLVKYIPNLDEIITFSKISNDLNYSFNSDVITKNIMFHGLCYDIKLRSNHSNSLAHCKTELNGICYDRDSISEEEINDALEFSREIFLYKNSITFNCSPIFQNLAPDYSDYLCNEIVKELKLDRKLFQNATTICLLNDVELFINDSCPSAMIRIFSYLEHPNIKCIKVPISSFLGLPEQSEDIRQDIFRGFPNLNELEFYITDDVDTCCGLRQNRILIDLVLKDLSERKNATLILNLYKANVKDLVFQLYIVMITALQYNIKLKFHCLASLIGCDHEMSIVLKLDHLLINQYIISVATHATDGEDLFDMMNKVQTLKNIEFLKLKIQHFDFEEEIKEFSDNCYRNLSFKTCNKLKKVKINFCNYYRSYGDEFDEELEDKRTETFCKNLKYIATLMPNSVTNLRLSYGEGLTTNVAEVINNHMPSINILSVTNTKYLDPDCLMVFKKVEILITCKYLPVKIPSTVNLFVIRCKDKFDRLTETKINKELLQEHSKRFTKKLQDNKGNFILFNDINQWHRYKSILHENIW